MTAHFLLRRVTPGTLALVALLTGGAAATAPTAPTTVVAADHTPIDRISNTIWD
ncbi:hypothetical protein OG936_02955 [Streptomyces sp. NBC_00846]|uniref:hypothetical protein n=1 Tax=Streptomyces sp. NBC_00846 TaxID=2975849 RepID=UPI00386777C0|nr:hypothetical protein OG936_02955 [Streptomyces sp. NBC_00846]